jgi:anthranilate/para-aminobenzoate synthase component I
MRPLIQEIETSHTPESLVDNLSGENGIVLLRTSQFDSPSARYSFVAANPMLTFRSFGSRCEISPPKTPDAKSQSQYGNPWHLLDALMARFELLDEIDSPFPLGGAFGYWGYDLKNFTEPKLPRRAVNDLELPDCHVGFYDSLVVFDHHLGRVCLVSTGLNADGSRCEARAQALLEFWRKKCADASPPALTPSHAPGTGGTLSGVSHESETFESARHGNKFSLALSERERAGVGAGVFSNISRSEFLAAVERARQYIRSGDIYQVNLSHRLTAQLAAEGRPRTRRVNRESLEPAGAETDARVPTGWDLFRKLSAVSPAPFPAYLDCDAGSWHSRFQIASSSPEQFLRLSGSHIVTRPIKGTRPRDADPTRDAQLAYELQTSAKELAELVMITDLLRNDLGKVCEYGSVQVPELARLEKFAQVQHLVSTVEGRLRNDVTHFAAFASCFPGGSITGAPKFRAMEIIDELEPVSRGPYCGAIGYLGFNRESQLSIAIRTAICRDGVAHFNVGAGIVADSDPASEYDETLAKALGFITALKLDMNGTDNPPVRAGGSADRKQGQAEG